MHDRDARACADAVGAGLDHGRGIARGANASGSFDPGAVADGAAKQRDIFNRGTGWSKTRTGLYVVSLGVDTELTG
ncbi:MAG: hypothetical protein JO187_08535 [Acidobacteria bacterium]|nr:hypothetical protein [Acidobacteriota bacterium]